MAAPASWASAPAGRTIRPMSRGWRMPASRRSTGRWRRSKPAQPRHRHGPRSRRRPQPPPCRRHRRPGGAGAARARRRRSADGGVTAYACHPVVLSADNRLWTADYPHFVRTAIEAANPGAVAIFVTGCAGDANTGHSAYASQTLAASGEPHLRHGRTARPPHRRGRAGRAGTPLRRPSVAATDCTVDLKFERRETAAPAENWRTPVAQPGRRRTGAPRAARSLGPLGREMGRRAVPPITGRGGSPCFDWGGVPIVALPGEIFAETGLSIRAALGEYPGVRLLLCRWRARLHSARQRIPVRRLRGRRSASLLSACRQASRRVQPRPPREAAIALAARLKNLSGRRTTCTPLALRPRRLTSQPVA